MQASQANKGFLPRMVDMAYNNGVLRDDARATVPHVYAKDMHKVSCWSECLCWL